MFSTHSLKRIAAVCSMMLTLVLVFGMVTPVYAASYSGVAGNKSGGTMNFILWVAVIVLLALCACLIYNLRKQMTARSHEKAVAAEKYRRLSRLNKETNRNLKLADKDIADLEEWQARAIKVNPTIQKLINEQISKEKAENFTADYLQTNTEGMEAFQAYEVFERIFLGYDALDLDVKQFVTCDMVALKESFREVTEQYINESVTYLNQVNRTHLGKLEDLEELDQALSYYENLPYAIKKAIPERLVSNLRLKIASAEMHLPLNESAMLDERPANFSFAGTVEEDE